jgi:hypothetical protein
VFPSISYKAEILGTFAGSEGEATIVPKGKRAMEAKPEVSVSNQFGTDM